MNYWLCTPSLFFHALTIVWKKTTSTYSLKHKLNVYGFCTLYGWIKFHSPSLVYCWTIFFVHLFFTFSLLNTLLSKATKPLTAMYIKNLLPQKKFF